MVDQLGDIVKWLHVPSHIGIKGNGRADHLLDVGRRHSPLLLGRISIHPPPPPLQQMRNPNSQTRNPYGAPKSGKSHSHKRLRG